MNIGLYIGVAGQKQNGKDSISDYLKEQLNKDEKFKIDFERAAFAKNVKRVFAETFNVSYEFIEEWKVKEEPPPGFDMNVRQALQFIGDGFRKIKASIWIDLMFRNTGNKIISDVRYINEAKRIVEEGGFNILVAHPDRVNDDANLSEAQIRPYAVWCLENMSSSDVIVPQVIQLDEQEKMPEDLKYFSLFVRNDKGMQDLYRVADELVIPYIKQFVRDMDTLLPEYDLNELVPVERKSRRAYREE